MRTRVRSQPILALVFLMLFIVQRSVGQENVVDSPERRLLPLLLDGKISGARVNAKLVLMLAKIADTSTTDRISMQPTVFDVDDFSFYDFNGQQLSVEEAAKATPRLTSILVVTKASYTFGGLKSLALLEGGGVAPVLAAESSDQDVGSGGVLAAVNGIGLESRWFPARHAGMNQVGWLGRNPLEWNLGGLQDRGWLHFDLGKPRKLTGLRVWGSNDTELRGRSVRDIEIYAATDNQAFGDNQHRSWKKVGSANDIPIGPGYKRDTAYGFTSPFSQPQEARYVRLQIVRNWGNAFNTLLAEVQFYAEPKAELIAIPNQNGLHQRIVQLRAAALGKQLE